MNLIKKNAKGYGYQYTDLAEINKLLAENNIEYYQYIEVVGEVDYIMTVLIQDGKELPARRGCRVTQATLKGISNPAQEQGSALTYARRYSLLMACGLATTDDDAASLTRPNDMENAISDTQKDSFKKACEKLNVDYVKILRQAGWVKGTVTTELLGKANIILKEISDEAKK